MDMERLLEAVRKALKITPVNKQNNALELADVHNLDGRNLQEIQNLVH